MHRLGSQEQVRKLGGERYGMDPGERAMARPWPVHVLTLLAVTTAVFGLLVGDRSFWDIPMALFGVSVGYSMWNGKRWAFTVMFMLTSLCAGFLLTVAVVPLALLEQRVAAGLGWGLATAMIWIGLLMHPATKKFAGIDRPDESSRAGTTTRGAPEATDG